MQLSNEQKEQIAKDVISVLEDYQTEEDGQGNKALLITDFDKVGRQLRLIRMKKGIPLTDLSEKVGVTYAFMCKVEHGQMSLTKTRQLMDWVKGLGFDEVRLPL